MKVEFVDPVVKNGKRLAVIDEEDVASEVKRWENAVVAYLLSRERLSGYISPFKDKFLNNLINSEWREYGPVKVHPQGKGVYVLDFESAEGKAFALVDKGPRFYDGSQPLILKPWTSDMSLDVRELKSVPIWINFPNLRLHLWSPRALSKIASLVGKPLFPDAGTASRENIKYARICVEVEFGKKLPDFVTIEDRKGCIYNQKVEYEWRPPVICFDCKQFRRSNSWPIFDENFCQCCEESGPRNFRNNWAYRGAPSYGGAVGGPPVLRGMGSGYGGAIGGPGAYGGMGAAYGGTSSSTEAFGANGIADVGYHAPWEHRKELGLEAGHKLGFAPPRIQLQVDDIESEYKDEIDPKYD